LWVRARFLNSKEKGGLGIFCLILAVLFWFNIISLGSVGSQTLSALPTITEQNCIAQGHISFGDSYLDNDVWGDSSAKTCIQIYSSGAVGWNWTKPLFSTNPIFPEVHFVPSYNASSPSLRNVVTPISSIQSLTIKLAATITGTFWDFIFDIWVGTGNQPYSSWPVGITDEIEIAMYGGAACCTPRYNLATISDGYNNYTEYGYSNSVNNCLSGASSSSQCVEDNLFVIDGIPRIPAVINIVPFLQLLQIEGRPVMKENLWDVEIGNEVRQGSGSTRLTTYDVNMALLTNTTMTVTSSNILQTTISSATRVETSSNIPSPPTVQKAVSIALGLTGFILLWKRKH